MTDTRVFNGVQRGARSRFSALLKVLDAQAINTVPHLSINKVRVLPRTDIANFDSKVLVSCIVIQARAPSGDHGKKDLHETAIHKAFVQFIKEEIEKLADDPRSKLGSTLARQKFQKIRLQVVEMSRARLRTKEMVESVLLPLG